MVNYVKSFLKHTYSNFILLDCLSNYNELGREDILFVADKLLNTINNDILIQIVVEQPESDDIQQLFRKYIDSLGLKIVDYPRQMVVEYFKLIKNNLISLDEIYSMLSFGELVYDKWNVDIFTDFFQIYEFISENPNSDNCATYLKFLYNFISKSVETNGGFELVGYQLIANKVDSTEENLPKIDLDNRFISNIWDNFILLDCMLYYDCLINDDILFVTNTLLNNIENGKLIDIAVQDDNSEKIKPLFREFLDGLNLGIQNYAKQITIEYFKLIASGQLNVIDGMEELWKFNYTHDYDILEGGAYNIYLIYDYIDRDRINLDKAVKIIKNEINKYLESNGNYDLGSDKAWDLATSLNITAPEQKNKKANRILISSNGDNAYTTEVDITILNYERPTLGDDYWDNNWYNVRIIVKQDDRVVLNQTDPCLTSFELKQFGQKIIHLSQGEFISEYFTEPTLEFTVREKNNKTLFGIKVYINDNTSFFEFAVDWNDLKNIANQIDEILKKFPIRNKQSKLKTVFKKWF
jgi:hypothetical protein